MIRRIYHRLPTSELKQLYRIADDERESSSIFDVSLRRRLWLYRHGFLTRSGVLYDFDNHDESDFLSDYTRKMRTEKINSDYKHHLSDKLVTHYVLNGFDQYLPTLYGVIDNGRFYPEADSGSRNLRDSIKALFEDKKKVVFKGLV